MECFVVDFNLCLAEKYHKETSFVLSLYFRRSINSLRYWWSTPLKTCRHHVIRSSYFYSFLTFCCRLISVLNLKPLNRVWVKITTTHDLSSEKILLFNKRSC